MGLGVGCHLERRLHGFQWHRCFTAVLVSRFCIVFDEHDIEKT